MVTVTCISISFLSAYLAFIIWDNMKYHKGCFWDDAGAYILPALFLGSVIGGGVASGSSKIGLKWSIVLSLSPIIIFIIYFVRKILAMTDGADYGKELSCTIGSIKWNYRITSIFPLEACIQGFNRVSPGSEIVVPGEIAGNQVAEIGEKVFMGHDEIEKIAIEVGSGMRTIREKAFYGCSGMTKAVLPYSLNRIGDSAFEYCSKVKEIKWELGDFSLKEYSYIKGDFHFFIGERAFAGCKSLESFTVPAYCEVGKGAFEGCVELKTISIPPSLAGKTENWGLSAECKIVVRKVVTDPLRIA